MTHIKYLIPTLLSSILSSGAIAQSSSQGLTSVSGEMIPLSESLSSEIEKIIDSPELTDDIVTQDEIELKRLLRRMEEGDSIRLSKLKKSLEPDEVITEYYTPLRDPVNRYLVFHGLRYVQPVPVNLPVYSFRMDARENAYDADRYAGILYAEPILEDSLEEGDEILSIAKGDTIVSSSSLRFGLPDRELDYSMLNHTTPEWLTIMRNDLETRLNLEFLYMISHPEKIKYAYWNLPAPPQLEEEDMTFRAFLNRLHLPPISTAEAVLPEIEIKKVHWLHNVATALQFSQAYISRNWYQGGNDYLALLFNFNWNVALNTVYHPDLMFTSDLSYKLAINSNSRESLHRYSIAQDQFQYNLKAGVKAFRKWFYSFNLQFKTQFFNSYPADSPTMNAAFLAPADLNMGLGMTYNLTARNNTLKFSASISPFSYNLKACMGNKIDPTLFNINPGKHTRSEFGSNGEITLNWDITANISWKSRLFLFTDYHYFQGDWENTFNFSINRFLSTQLYICPRYDSSTDFNMSRWHYWMLKEVLSFGLSYTFSTAP